MGAIGGILGLSGGANGTGFSGPQGAPIVNTTNPAQTSAAYTGTQGSLSSQQALLSALQAQNGLGNQSQVYNQFQGIANGKGPNPAQAMLNQSTGQNVANQGALMAGQRGASSNVGLIAKQAAQQGSAIQQNAAGQAATLQANQSLNALNSAGNMANTQAANQIGATTTNTQANLAEQQALMNAQNAYNQNQVSMQNNINSSNAGLAQTNMGGQQSFLGGVGNAAGGATGLFASGGAVQGTSGPRSMIAKHLSSGGVMDYRQGGDVMAANPAQKATVSGNSYSNDKIPALLSEKEIVIPRSVLQSKDPIGGSARFVSAVLAKKGKG